MARVVLLLMLCACGRLHFDLTSADDGGPGDGFGDAAVPQPVTELNTPFDEDDVSLTGDMLEIYFDSDRSGLTKIWRATRTATDLPWDSPAPVAELNFPTDADQTPMITADGLTIYFSSTRGMTNQDLYVSQRATRGDMWSPPVIESTLSSGSADFRAALSADRLRVYFSSSRGAGSNLDLWTSTRVAPADAWPTPTRITELDTVAQDAEPWLSDDELTIVFASSRDAPRRDLFLATRGMRSDPFGAAVPVPDVNTFDYAESGPWLSPDQHVLIFASDRSGTADIYTVALGL